MTQHWADIDNTSLLLVWGANPVENHPACAAHMNAARDSSKKARLIVIDPRLTRTGRQINPNRLSPVDGVTPDPDLYVRIRPGTDIAFGNGLLNYILNGPGRTYSGRTLYKADGTTVDSTWDTIFKRMLAYHNGTDANFLANRSFIADGQQAAFTASAGTWQTASYTDASTPFGTAAYLSGTAQAATGGYPKYADTRFLVDVDAANYQRSTLTITTTVNPAGAATVANFPLINADVADGTAATPTVWNLLKKHVAAYDNATVMDICGCGANDVENVAKALLDHSRFGSDIDWNQAKAKPKNAKYRATTILYAMGQTQHTYGSQNIKNFAIIETLLGNMGRPGGGINALRGIHNVQGSTDMGVLYNDIPGYYGANPGANYQAWMDPMFGNRMTGGIAANATLTIGATTSGVLFTASPAATAGMLGNKVRVRFVNGGASQPLSVAVSGSAITVNLATDAGSVVTSIANDVITAVNGDSAAQLLVVASAVSGGTGLVAAAAYAYLTGGKDASSRHLDTSFMGIQQRGFHNMSNEWFGNGTSGFGDMNTLYGVWPKGNGTQHIQAFRNMAGSFPTIKAAVVWGQNPAISEPNQTAVRAGLKKLQLLVVTDVFLTETATCDRDGTTYFIPAASYVEEAGSVTSSGRWIQWRYQACKPKGNTRSDLELLLRLAYALDGAGAFSHITSAWTGLTEYTTTIPTGSAYDVLFGKYTIADPYDFVTARWNPTSATAFENLSSAAGASEMWGYDQTTHLGQSAPTTFTAKGSDFVAENIYKEMTRPLNFLASGAASSRTGGTVWIYSGSDSGTTLGPAGYNAGTSWNGNVIPAITTAPAGATINWEVKNRAKSRNNRLTGDNALADGNANHFPRWGYAWLYNRRVFYNNGEVQGDQGDNFVSPGLVSCLYTMNNATTLADWANAYRGYKKYNDRPSSNGITSKHWVASIGASGASLAGRFPGHNEPYESPRDGTNLALGGSLMTDWGYNTSGGTVLLPIPAGGIQPTDRSSLGTAAVYPLVLTTIRCVEHFQGGPITRNNSWNVEAEPVPWIEIHPEDARKNSIKDGDWVNVITIRSNTKTDQAALAPNATPGWNRGFKARVGVGLESNQRVAPGVVAIPWHWGEKGLGTGSRANDLCVDAFDANSQIPEYKACLCSIEKM